MTVAQVVGEDVVVCRGIIPRFYKETNCRPPAILTQYRNHYTHSFVRGRQANSEDIPKILEIAARDIWRVPSSYTVLLEQRAKDHFANNVRTIAQNFCQHTYRSVVEALDIIQKAALPLAEVVHGRLLFENIIFQNDGQPVFVNPIDPCQVITPSLDRGALLMSAVMRWDETAGPDESMPWEKPKPWPEWANVVDWAFLVAGWVRELPQYPGIKTGFPILGSLKPE